MSRKSEIEGGPSRDDENLQSSAPSIQPGYHILMEEHSSSSRTSMSSSSDEEGAVVQRPDGLKVRFYYHESREGILKRFNYIHDDNYFKLIGRLSDSNPASQNLRAPIIPSKILMTINEHGRFVNPKDRLSKQLGFDRSCPDWDYSTTITFPLGLNATKPRFLSAAELNPIKLQVLRCHICVITLHLIWASIMEHCSDEPAKALFFPDSLPDESARAKVASLREFAIWPIFGSTQSCWKAFELEISECWQFLYYWPADCEDSPDLPEVRDMLSAQFPRSALICHLLEAMIGQKPYFPHYSTLVMHDSIFRGPPYDF